MRTLFASVLIALSLSCHAAPPSDESIDALLAASKAENVLDVAFAGM